MFKGDSVCYTLGTGIMPIILEKPGIKDKLINELKNQPLSWKIL